MEAKESHIKKQEGRHVDNSLHHEIPVPKDTVALHDELHRSGVKTHTIEDIYKHHNLEDSEKKDQK
jgi:hypothetical protein